MIYGVIKEFTQVLLNKQPGQTFKKLKYIKNKLLNELILSTAAELDDDYQEWLDSNRNIEIISTALTYDHDLKLLVLLVTYIGSL